MDAKQISRFKPIILSGLNSAIAPISNLIISYIVIHNFGSSLWGNFIQQLLWLNIGAHIASFGSKEFLLRNFANNPHNVSEEWQHSFNARFNFLFLFTLVILVLKLNTATCISLITWLLCRFIYQSYEPLIVWHRKFGVNFLCELVGGLFIITTLVVYQKQLSTVILVQLFAVAEIFKFTIAFVYFRKEVIPTPKFTIDFTTLKNSFIFFLIGFGGLLHSRVDQLIATKYLIPSELAYYQILMSILLLLQSIAYFIIQPFLKNIYRLQIEIIKQLSLKLFIVGALLSPLLLVAMGFLLQTFYHFEITPITLIAGYFFVLPFFYSIPFIYYLYKLKEENKVLIINLIIILLNLIFLPIIFPSKGIEGALLFSGILQILQAIVFRVISTK